LPTNAEQTDLLEGARNPMPNAAMGGKAREIYLVEHHGAGVRPVDAAQQIEQGGLAGAVGSYNGEHDTLPYGKRYVLHRMHAAEPLVETFGAQQYVPSLAWPLPPPLNAPSSGALCDAAQPCRRKPHRFNDAARHEQDHDHQGDAIDHEAQIADAAQ
jgi:hypothetical protein